MTLVEQLESKTRAVKQYRRKKEERENRKQQEITDKRFRSTASSARDLGEAVRLAKESLDFHPSEKTTKALFALADALDNVVKDALADEEAATNAKKGLEEASSCVKGDWDKCYRDIVNPAKGALEAVKTISPERAQPILKDIDQAKTWQDKPDCQVKVLIDAIAATQKLVGELGLNEAVENFLRKASSGSATLDDLTYDVYTWLKESSLEGNVRLTLASCGATSQRYR